MDNLVTYLQDGFMYVGIVVTAATAIVAALEKVAEVTPTTKDDEYIGKAKQWLGVINRRVIVISSQPAYVLH